MAALAAVEKWLETVLCISAPAYMSKGSILRSHFSSLLQCDILLDPNAVIHTKRKGDDKYVFEDDEGDDA